MTPLGRPSSSTLCSCSAGVIPPLPLEGRLESLAMVAAVIRQPPEITLACRKPSRQSFLAARVCSQFDRKFPQRRCAPSL